MLERKGTKYTPDNVPMRVIYQCYFFSLGLTMMVLAIIAYGSFLDKLENYYYIIDNWKQDVLLDVQVVQEDDDCSNLSSRLGSDYETLVKYFWPGTVAGCDCRDGTRNERLRILDFEPEPYSFLKGFYPQDKIYDDHACNSTQQDYGCKNIPSQSSRDFNYWNDGVTTASFKLCGKRLKGYNFVEKAPLTGSCTKGQKRCGSQTNDDQFFCVQSDSLCPITQIGFEGQDSSIWKGSKILSSDEIVRIAIGQRLSLFYLRTYQDQLPVVEFRITESNEVCMKNKKTNISPGRTDYILMEEKKQSCSTDERFQAMHFIDEETFYRTNKQLDLEQKLRGYEIDKGYQWGMFNRGIILWKLHCRGELMQDFINQSQSLESIASSQLGLLVISIIFFILISFMLSIVIAANIFGYDWPCIKGEGSEESNYIFTFEIILKILLQTTQAIVVLVAFSRVRDEINFLNGLIDVGCSDSVTLMVLGDLRDVLKEKVYGYNTGQLVLFVITSLMDFGIVGRIALLKRQKASVDQVKFEGAINPMDGNINQLELQKLPPQIAEQQYQPLPQQFPQYQQPAYDNNIPVQGGVQIGQPQIGGIQAGQPGWVQTGGIQYNGQQDVNLVNPYQQNQQFPQPHQNNPQQQNQYPNQHVSGPYG